MSEEEDYLFSDPCPVFVEPTFTLAQVKEIIEGIAVRLEQVESDKLPYHRTGKIFIDGAAKIVRETEI